MEPITFSLNLFLYHLEALNNITIHFVKQLQIYAIF